MMDDKQPEPGELLALVQQSFLVGFTIHGVEGGKIGVGRGACGGLARFTVIRVV